VFATDHHRLENPPGLTALKRTMVTMVEVRFEQVTRRIMLDIDDTEDRAHGSQQLALWNGLLRQPLLSTDPHLRGDDRQTGGDHPARRQNAGRR
jgi:hypothetical protein